MVNGRDVDEYNRRYADDAQQYYADESASYEIADSTQNNDFKYTEFFGMIGATLIIPYSFGTIQLSSKCIYIFKKQKYILFVATLCFSFTFVYFHN